MSRYFSLGALGGGQCCETTERCRPVTTCGPCIPQDLQRPTADGGGRGASQGVADPLVPFGKRGGPASRGGGYTDPGRDAGGATGPRADPFGRGGSTPHGAPRTPGGKGPVSGYSLSGYTVVPGLGFAVPLSGGYFFTRPNGCGR